MRNKILIIMGFIMLVGFITIGFFIFPIGITLCAVIGLIYGYRKGDKSFIRWSFVSLFVGLFLAFYTLGVINSM